MEDPIERLHITLPSSVVRAVEDFRFTERVPSRAEAIRRLIELGLAASRKTPAK